MTWYHCHCGEMVNSADSHSCQRDVITFSGTNLLDDGYDKHQMITVSGCSESAWHIRAWRWVKRVILRRKNVPRSFNGTYKIAEASETVLTLDEPLPQCDDSSFSISTRETKHHE